MIASSWTRTVVAAGVLTTLVGCSSDDGNPGGAPPVIRDPAPPPDYCPDAVALQKGGAYYAVREQCVANAYADKATLLTILDKYINDPSEMKALADAVCIGPNRAECLAGPLSLPLEVTGLRNVITTTGARDTLCDIGIQTGAQVNFQFGGYVEEEKCLLALGGPPATYPVIWLLDADIEGVKTHVDQNMAAVTAGNQPTFLTAAEIASTYGASSSDRKVVTDYFATQTITGTLDSMAGFYETQMTAAQIKAVLDADVSSYQGSEESGWDVPKIPSALAAVVTNVLVLAADRAGMGEPVTLETPTTTPADCGAVKGTLSASELNTAYGIDALHEAGWSGSGIHAATIVNAIIKDSFFAYEDCFPDVTAPLVYHPLTPAQSGLIPEGTSDIQIFTFPAPTLGRFDFYSLGGLLFLGHYELQSVAARAAALMSSVVDPSKNGGSIPSVLTESYAGPCAEDPETEPLNESTRVFYVDQTYRLALTGMTMFFASGDTGNYTSSSCATWPNVSAPVTAVGGTTLKLEGGKIDGPTGQAAWSGSGGGIVDAPQPSYQAGIYAPNGTKRLVPDVASYASPGFPLYTMTQAENTGSGTSGAAPYTAGAVALIVEATGKRLGPLNPFLYKAATQNGGADYDTYFYDVITGDNDSGATGCCDAAPGFDLATGLGSIRYDAFLDFVKDETKGWTD